MSDLHSLLANWRHHLHERPELGFEEVETSEFVARRLAEFGIPVTRGIGGTGLVGVVEGRPGRRMIALRAELDALPIEEAAQRPYSSKHAGRMHACGHDGHIAMLLGAARALAGSRDFSGTVLVVFQPAEETGGGARVMIEDGLFERFPVHEVYGLHNWPGLAERRFAVRPGAVMAASDRFDITVRGAGCHAAMPHLGRDPIVAAAQIVTGIQQLVSRQTAPWEPVVASITRLHSGTAYNVIPETAQLAGTLRALGKRPRQTLRNGIRRVARNIAASHGVHADVQIVPGYPVTINSQAESSFASQAAASVSGETVLTDYPASMATEDFAYMLERKPGCYAWLGAGGQSPPLHSDTYDFNDALLPLGVDYWLSLVRMRLGGTAKR